MSAFDEDGFALFSDYLFRCGNVFFAQLLLQIDRARGNNDALAVRNRPQHRGDEISVGFSDAGSRFEYAERIFIEGAGDASKQGDLHGALFVAFGLHRKRTAVFEIQRCRIDIEFFNRFRFDRFHDDVHAGRAVVDDVKTLRALGGCGSGRHIRVGRFEVSARMIVDENRAFAHVVLIDGNFALITASADFYRNDDTRRIDIAGKKHFVTARFSDGAFEFIDN